MSIYTLREVVIGVGFGDIIVFISGVSVSVERVRENGAKAGRITDVSNAFDRNNGGFSERDTAAG